MSKKALGKGLSALISTQDDEDVITFDKERNGQSEISINKLRAGRAQPRGYFEENKLQELAESIQKNGVLQPILVRKLDDSDTYEIIAGERRFRAAKIIGLESIPAIIKDSSDKEALEIALIENIQRENLTPIEEAEGYKRLQDELQYTQEQLSGVLGKSRSHVANMLRLLSLPQDVKDMVNAGLLSMGHARVLIGTENPLAIAEQIINEGLSVRETEKLLNKGNNVENRTSPVRRSSSRNSTPIEKDEDLAAIEKSLSESIGLRVVIEDSAKGGRVIFHFNNLAELDKILQKVG